MFKPLFGSFLRPRPKVFKKKILNRFSYGYFKAFAWLSGYDSTNLSFTRAPQVDIKIILPK